MTVPKSGSHQSAKVTGTVEMRRYVRMDTVLPVEVTLRNLDGGGPTVQAFTRNVSRGGMCIELAALGPLAEGAGLGPSTVLHLLIHPLFSPKPIRAVSRVIWHREDETYALRYRVGVVYEEVDGKDARRIWSYALMRRWFPRFSGVLIVFLIGTVIFLTYRQQELIRENEVLVRRIVEEARSGEALIADVMELGAKGRKLEEEVRVHRKRLRELAQSPPLDGTMAPMALDALGEERDSLRARMTLLEGELSQVRSAGVLINPRLSAMEEGYLETRGDIVHQLYDWLRRHRQPRTGLVASFEGDPELEGVSFTYDQALLVQAFSLFGDFDFAREILSFYRDQAQRAGGAFYTAYHASSGKPMEWDIVVGPNVWIGMAALQYQRMTGDPSFEPLAVDIGDWLLALQNEDPEGGLRGGPDITWFSSEHNLDAYAFYGMLHKVTGKEKYLRAREDVFHWLLTHAADYDAIRIRRGKGDATIATDTFSWSIAAIGPERLSQVDFDPEGIMEFAEEHCRVTVPFRRPEGETVEVTGFDFAKHTHMPRGGIVSTEWTAQAVVTYRILADYFDSQGKIDKAVFYRAKVYHYLHELQKMIISSASRTGQGKGCLPYASQPNADTGHGWRTPMGDRTGSVAGTAYGLFAWLGYNPFDLTHKVDIPLRSPAGKAS